MIWYWLKKLDKKILAFFSQTGGIVILFWETLVQTMRLAFKGFRVLVKINEIGLGSVPIVMLIALFVGMVLALQTFNELARFGAQLLVAKIVCVSMLRELGPIFTAVILVGRIGARFTAEIGSMQVTEQIRALQALHINPVSYLVVPRALALGLALPALVLVADFTGILGGFGVAVFQQHVNASAYLASTISAFEIKDLVCGLLKAEVFALIIVIIGCFKGFITHGGTEGVGKYTTSAVVVSISLILISDFFLTKLIFVFFS
ncbi:ABC transporter permease [bacterium]|nr:ABC transporter permease [bacterium]